MDEVKSALDQYKKQVVHLLKTITVALLVIFFLWLGAIGFWSIAKGYSLEEMDWDQNGSTSIQEIFMSSDIGKRNIKQSGKMCIEYFSFKDGMSVKIVCPETTPQ